MHKLQSRKGGLKIHLQSLLRDSDTGKHQHWISRAPITIFDDNEASDGEDSPMRNSRKGPRQRCLRELHCADWIHNPVISYRFYRIRMTDQVIDDQITAASGLKQRRIDHSLKDRKFSGIEPLKMLSLFSIFKTQCDANRI